MNIRLSTEKLGEITIPLTEIKASEKILPSQIIKGKIWETNFQDARYFFSPNGYGLRKGEAYYQNVWIFYNQFSVGITNNISIGGGLVPLFLFNGAPTPLWLIPKVSFPVVKDKFNIGAGALVGTVLGENRTSFGIVFGTTTFGSRDKNLSIGLGYGYAGQNFAKKPVINVSALIRTSRRSYFITENYYLPFGDDALILISLGGRSVIKRVGIDYGLFLPFQKNVKAFFAIPWLGLTVSLGKQKKILQ
jgi:hypothetical protein